MNLKVLRKNILSWYRQNRRDLPWRREPDLYRTLLSEFMLQQTRVEQALPYFERFLKRFPTLKKLAAAPQGDVLKLWEGLGYYSRAAHLHQTARQLAGRSKITLEDLRSCPGIGPYTLAAISSIVWNEPLPVADGNVNRVLARMLALEKPPLSPEGKAVIQTHLSQWLPPHEAGDWNQALMELGATVCTPRRPACDLCPLSRWCRACSLKNPEAFPVRLPKRARPHYQTTAAIIRRDGRRYDRRILIAQRPPRGLLPNLWEFPGGRQKAKETLEQCCARSIREELGIEVAIGPRVTQVEHAYTHFSITLHVFEGRYQRGEPRALGCQAWRWVQPRELKSFPFPRSQWSIGEQVCKSL